MVGGDSCRGKTQNSLNRIQIMMLRESKARHSRNVAALSWQQPLLAPLRHISSHLSASSGLRTFPSLLVLGENDCRTSRKKFMRASSSECHHKNSNTKDLFNQMRKQHTIMKFTRKTSVCAKELKQVFQD